MSSRISIYDKSGKYLTEIDATFNRDWIINAAGKGSFIVSTSDSKCREDYLRFGNFIYVEHDKLPVWSGMIDTPREWLHGAVKVHAYTAEYILKTRISQRTSTLEGTPGGVIAQLIEEIWDAGDYNPVRAGNIYGGDPVIKRVYNFEEIYKIVTEIAADAGRDWDLEPIFDNYGRLYFQLNYYERKGMAIYYPLYEDKNIELSSNLLREQGRIGNRLRIYGDGANFNERPVTRRDDTESIGKYGPRFIAELAAGVTSDQLSDIADERLKLYAEPRKTFDLVALDVGDTYKHIRLGNRLPVSCHSVGFSGSGFGSSAEVRILQIDYKEDKNTLKLVADEVR